MIALLGVGCERQPIRGRSRHALAIPAHAVGQRSDRVFGPCASANPGQAHADYVSTTCGSVLTRAGNDRHQVDPVRGTIARVVLFESGRTPLEEPASAGAVPAAPQVW